MKYVSPILIGIVILITFIVVRAWAVSTLWGWFVVPAFGLPPISKITAYGLSSLVSLFTTYTAQKSDSEKSGEDTWAPLWTAGGHVLGILVTVGVCGIVLLFSEG